MLNKEFKLMENSNATLTSYVIQQDPFDHRGLKRPAVIICPGGGYQAVSYNEGEPVALAYMRNGYCAFVLRYSVKIENPFPKALTELASAVKFVRDHANVWNIDANDISVAGFSAGGHLAMSLGVFYHHNFVLQAINATEDEVKPNAVILGYPAITLHKWNDRPVDPSFIKLMEDGIILDMRGPDIALTLSGKIDATPEEIEYLNLINHVSEKTPPVFMWGSNQDPVIHPSDLWDLAAKLREFNVPYEMHIFGRGPHGQATSDILVLDKQTLAKMHEKEWLPLSLMWLEENRYERYT